MYKSNSENLPQSAKDALSYEPRFPIAVLFVTVMMTFGGHFCFDAPSVMAKQMQDEFHLSATQFHSFFMMNSWSHLVMGLVTGLLIDRFGSGRMAVGFSIVLVIGQSVFAFGASISSYWLMLIARSVYSLGSGSIFVVQTAICAKSFRYKGMGLAFGFILTISHLGSIVNFIVTPLLVNKIGVVRTLWFGDGLAIISLLCAFVFYYYDLKESKFAVTTAEDFELMETYTRRLRLHNIKKLTKPSLHLFTITAFYYSIIFPFNSLSSKYFQVEFGYSLRDSSWIAGIIFYMGFVFGPLFGALVDFFGRRAHLGVIGFATIAPSLIWIFATRYTPIPAMIGLGISFAIVPQTLYGSIPKVVDSDVVGTAMGINFAFHSFGVGTTQLIVGLLEDHYGYQGIFYHLFALSFVGLILFLVLDMLWFNTQC